ncbi:MAG: DUF5597 domain-containing protein [Lachnospiraceae bacterium]|nr:DUF5597 domain-containing protein [Lachnospiraceae bacterium]
MFQKERLDFFSIGGQVNNSSSVNKETIDRGFQAILQYKLNTAAFPLYWSSIEPREGTFDYQQVDYIIEQATRHGLKLTLLWFGTWKNGASHYVPEWVKADHTRFPRVIDALGNEAMVLSPHAEQTLQADKKAFSMLLRHIREVDRYKTVIAVQVENEPGIHAAARDYGISATLLFKGEVPEEVRKLVQEQSDPELTGIWKRAGAHREGSWEELFGIDAEECFSAYYFAKYINEVGEAGKQQYDIPLYVNVWVRETMNRIQGQDFPCGGATSLVLGIWKKFAPVLSCICPDVYFDDRETYMDVCRKYTREDNVLYIPESHADEINSLRLFEAIERFDLTGIHAFAIDATLTEDGGLTKAGADFKRTVDILSAMKPLLETYYKTGRIHAVVQQEYADSMFLDLGNWYGRVLFLNTLSTEPYIHLDNLHEEDKYRQVRGKGLIVDAGDGNLYLAGEGFKLILLPKKSATQTASFLYANRGICANNAPFLRVDEGYMDETGTFVSVKQRTGDEDDNGLWVTSDVGLVRAVIDTQGGW